MPMHFQKTQDFGIDPGLTFLVFLFPADGSSKVVTIEVVVVQGRLKWKRTNTPQVTPLLRWDRIVPRRHTY